MKKPETEFDLRIRPRATEMVFIQIPVDSLASLRKVAAARDMSDEALLKLYIGQGLRQDLARLFSDRVIATTAQVLARHIPSEDEVTAIIREIQLEAVA
ncbi:MAG: hypothetical protein NT169_08620 [Chloroflexi bacterium]|nr:hypothetical protein [Chloroflexota bacterium]